MRNVSIDLENITLHSDLEATRLDIACLLAIDYGLSAVS